MVDFATLLQQLPAVQARNATQAPIAFDLKRAMRRHHVTIRELARRMQITHKRVRQVRAAAAVPFITALDFQEAVETAVR